MLFENLIFIIERFLSWILLLIVENPSLTTFFSSIFVFVGVIITVIVNYHINSKRIESNERIEKYKLFFEKKSIAYGELFWHLYDIYLSIPAISWVVDYPIIYPFDRLEESFKKKLLDIIENIKNKVRLHNLDDSLIKYIENNIDSILSKEIDKSLEDKLFDCYFNSIITPKIINFNNTNKTNRIIFSNEIKAIIRKIIPEINNLYNFVSNLILPDMYDKKFRLEQKEEYRKYYSNLESLLEELEKQMQKELEVNK